MAAFAAISHESARAQDLVSGLSQDQIDDVCDRSKKQLERSKVFLSLLEG